MLVVHEIISTYCSCLRFSILQRILGSRTGKCFPIIGNMFDIFPIQVCYKENDKIADHLPMKIVD